jgi:uncharacterized membrane protein
MELSIKTFFLFGSVILTGLSAGLFYSWSVSVIPGTQNVVDSTYLETMQSINREILNPLFFLIFFGSLVFLGITSVYEFYNNQLTFWFVLSATITYLIGTLGVTVIGNVPLNDQLAALKLKEMNVNHLAEFRKSYEIKWNQFHLVRTVFAVISFISIVLALLVETKT